MKALIKTEKAQGMVEFALVLPILLLISMGIFEFGRLLFIYSAINTASSEAVRYGSAVDNASGLPQFADCAGIQSAATNVGSLINLTGVLISYDEGPGAAVIASTCSALTAADIATIVGGRDRVLVQVQAFYQPIVPLVNIPGFTIRAQSVRTIVKDIDLGEGGAPGGGGGGPAAAAAAAAPSPPVVSIPSGNSPIAENGGVSTLTIALSEVHTSANVTVNLSTAGTAQAGDYTLSNSVVTILQGQTQVTVTVTAVDDTDDDDDETVIVSIASATNATVGSPGSYTVTITDDDTAVAADPLVRFISGNSPIAENGGVSTLTVGLTAAHPSQAVTVNFGAGGTAQSGDYILSSTSVVIPQGQTQASITVTAVDDSDDDDDEVVAVSITSVVNAIKGSPSAYNVTITDDGTTVPPAAPVSPVPTNTGGSGAVKCTVTHFSWSANPAWTGSPSSYIGTLYVNGSPVQSNVSIASPPWDLVPDQRLANNARIGFTIWAVFGTQLSSPLSITYKCAPAGLSVYP